MIGVILMVAITVILAAVIAAFVLGFGAETQAAPQASIAMDGDFDSDELTIEHRGGDSLDTGDLVLRGSGLNNDVAFEVFDGDFADGFSNGHTAFNDTMDFSSEGGTVVLIWESGGDSHQLASTDV